MVINKSLASRYGVDIDKAMQQSSANVKKLADDSLNAVVKKDTDKVTLSQEALAKLSQDNESKKSSTSSEQEINDNLLKSIKEQLAKLNKELKKLKYDDSEESERKRKQLQGQINALNASLLDLLGKKLNSL